MKLVAMYWRAVLARLPLPMLALAASYGVYSFALLFVPWWVAVIQASAFELVYVGLAVANLTPYQQARARLISLGAVVTSVVYNVLDGLFVRRPALLVDIPLWGDVLLAVVHGLPLAVLAYLVADLLLHETQAPKAAVLTSGAVPSLPDGADEANPSLLGRRPQVYTLDQVRLAVADAGEVNRAQLLERLGCSATTLDRLLGELVSQGQIVRLGRGVYRAK